MQLIVAKYAAILNGEQPAMHLEPNGKLLRGPWPNQPQSTSRSDGRFKELSR